MIEVLSEFIYDHEERAEKLAERLGNLEEEMLMPLMKMSRNETLGDLHTHF